MRSSLAKHLHPILGRRMVDWVVEAAGRSARSRSSSSRRPTAATAFEDVRVAVQERRSGPATRCARRGTRSATRTRSSSSRATRRFSRASCSPGCSTRIGAATRRRPCSRSSPTTFAATDGSCGTGTVISSRSWRRRTRRPRSSRYARRTPRSTCSVPTRSGPHSRGWAPANAQGELYLTDAVRGIVESGLRVGVHVAPDAEEAEGVNSRVELRSGDRVASRPDQPGAHARRVTIVDPGSTWIEPTVTLRAGRGRASVHRPSRGDERRRRAPRSGRTSSPWTRRSDRGPWSARSVTFAPAQCSGHPPRQARSSSSRTPGSARARRCRISSYMGDADVGDRTNVGAGSITANCAHERRPEAADRDRA